MSNDKKKAEKPHEKELETDNPEVILAPKLETQPTVLAVEQWAKLEPVDGITAEMVLAQGRWGQGKEITKSQWLSTAKAVLDTPIGFKN
jgi:hypothetical protein